MSTRHEAERQTARRAGPSPVAARLLDAAATAVARYGLRRTTMDDVARAAGCSRQTVYKHYPTRDDLFMKLGLREVAAYLSELNMLLERQDRLTTADLEDAFVFSIRHVQRHPVVQAVIEADEYGMVSMLAFGQGSLLTFATEGVSESLRRFMTSGVVRDVDPTVLGEAFVRMVASFLLLPPLRVDADDDDALRVFFRDSLLQGFATEVVSPG